MTSHASEDPFRHNQGTPQAHSVALHNAELLRYLGWFVFNRWMATGLCSISAILFMLPALQHMLRCTIDSRYFLIVASLLAASNLVHARSLAHVAAGQLSEENLFWSLNAQVLTDYVSLAILTYGLGGVETPILILFLPHIILVTLFFSATHSLIMTWVGIFFATLPMILEYLGIVATLSIFDTAHKSMFVSSNLVVTVGYIAGIIAAFLYCWYLLRRIISSLRLREQQLEQAYNRLDLLDREKSQMAVRATHELKAPFAAIKSYVYTLRDGYCGILPEKAQQVITRIGERCDLLTGKITDIIHLSNLRTATPTNTRLTPMNLMTVVTKEVAEARLIGQPRNITVDFQPEHTECMITGSEDHLHTMIANLLRNALTYSHVGGNVEISLRIKADKVSFHVQDHGIGIPEEHIEKIFQEHFRTNVAVRHNPNSSGMGLAMVWEIVRLHNGNIHVSSKLGYGTLFTVTFGLLNQQPKVGDNHGENPNH